MASIRVKEKNEANIQGLVLEIQKLSTEDGPGIRTSIFFKGCPLKCLWCHNPESIPKQKGLQWFENKCIGCKTCIDLCSEKAITIDEEGIHINREKCSLCLKCIEQCPSTALKVFGKEWTVNELLEEVEKDRIFYEKSNGGITISGGEPCLQMDFIVEFLKECKEHNLNTALDTCGYTTKQNLEKIIEYIDLILYDIKEIDSQKHLVFTSVRNETILDNCKWVVEKAAELKKEVWIRTPIIPNYTATENNIKGIARFIVKVLQNKIHRWDLLAFNNLCKEKYKRMDWKWMLEGERLLTKEEMEFYFNIGIQEGVKNVQWSGLTHKNATQEDN